MLEIEYSVRSYWRKCVRFSKQCFCCCNICAMFKTKDPGVLTAAVLIWEGQSEDGGCGAVTFKGTIPSADPSCNKQHLL